MKKSIIIIVISAFFQSAFGQLNPINNLKWSHWYVCPHNYFILSWGLPEPSQDTLVGYNIYRETDLYRFQTDTSLYHDECGGNCGEDFLLYNDQPFWIHVTAVYNYTQQESIYIDSAYCYGSALGIDEKIQSKLKLYPNPTTGKLKIDSKLKIKRIDIISQSGKVIKRNLERTELDLSNLTKGVYFIKAYTDKKVMMKAVILE